MTNEEILELLLLAGLQGHIRSHNVQVSCPFAAVSGHKNIIDQHPSLGFHATDDGAVWNCFTCGRHGGIQWFFTLLEAELGVDCDAVNTRLELIRKGDPEGIAAKIPEYGKHFERNVRRVYPVFPEEWLAPFIGKVPQYILDRGLKLPVLKEFQVGHDATQHRVVYPVRDRVGKLVGAVGGLTRKVEYQPKYKNYWHRIHSICKQPLEHRDGQFKCPQCKIYPLPEPEVAEGFRKSNFLYASWRFGEAQTPIVVEGIVDCLKIWQALQKAPKAIRNRFRPVAIFGSKPSKIQAADIVKLSSDRAVYIWMDNDLAGREGYAALRDMIRSRARIFTPEYPDDDEGSDPGSLTDAQIFDAIEKAKIVL